jgi:hypothetical protein
MVAEQRENFSAGVVGTGRLEAVHAP